MDTNHSMDQQERKQPDGGRGLMHSLSGWRDGFRRMSRRKKALVLVLPAAVLTAAGLILFLSLHHTNTADDRTGPPEGMTFGAEAVTATGLTSIGMTEEKYSLDFLETPLYVEENYLSVGDEVEEGTRAFKISEESLREAEEELTEAAGKTEYAYRQGVIDDMTGRLEAEADYRKAEVNLEYAQAEYDNALAEYAAQVSDLETQVADARELVDEYTEVVNNDYYYTDYHVKELQETYYDNFAYLMQLYEEWEIASLEDQQNSQNMMSQGMSGMKMAGGEGWPVGGSGTEDGAGTESGSGTGSEFSGAAGSVSGGSSQTVSSAEDNSAETSAGGRSGQTENTVGNDKLSVYQMFEELVERNGEEYEQAAENYEKDTAMAAASLNRAKSNLAGLEADLADARLEYEKQKIAAKQQYDTTVSESETAELTYRTELERLDEELSALKEAKDEAEENLELFRTTLSDGYFKTSGAGTVVMNRVREGSYLSGNDILLAYGDPEVLTVAASVDQSQIASVEVGESAYLMISGYGNFRGTVKSMDPNAASDNRSSVTYTVIIELEGETGELESNLTATVYLGLSEEDIQHMEQMSQRSEENPEAGADNGGKPEETDWTGGGPAFPEGGGREWPE